MNKKYIFWILIVIAIIIGIVVFFIYKPNNSYNNENRNYISTRTSQNVNDSQNFIEQNLNTDKDNNITEKEIGIFEDPIETEISSFTTKIYTKDSGRQNNITLACSTLNDTIVESGSTFSFSNTVGKATSSKGYKKADVFRNGDVVEALGGGLCQVSTTLYNAVLKVKDLKVTERHPHSNKVPYIKSGKDAAVSFGSQDFKFINNTGNSIKIKAENTPDNIVIKLLKLE